MIHRLCHAQGTILFSVLLLFSILSCSEQPYRHYSTYTEAVSAGELKRGWLPSWFPEKAHNIHIQGDLDINYVWVRFQLPTEVIPKIKSDLVFIEYRDIERFRWIWPRGASSWWFDGLVWQQPANDHALNADVFVGRPPRFRHEFFVAFDRLSDNIYAWWQDAEKEP